MDDRLSEAAASLLLRDAPITSVSLLASARSEGYDGVALRARESANEENLRSWLSELAKSEPGELECGEARSEQRHLVLATVRGGRLQRDGARVRGELAAGFRDPKLVLEGKEGELTSIALTLSELERGVSLPESSVRRIQLVAESDSGPRPVAELSSLPLPEPSASTGPKTRPVGELLAQLSTFRREQQVGTLRDNRLLRESAQRHATRVCELGRLAHRVDGEDPELRLKREHIGARGVGEAIARAESSDRALRVLFESPAHRLALAKRDFTDVGVGQATDEKGQLCLVVLLASWPRRLP